MTEVQDRRELARQTLALSLGKALSFLLLYLLASFLSRMLDKGTYGSFQQLWLIYYVMLAVFLAGLDQSIMYFVPRLAPENRKTFIAQTFLLLLFLSAASALLLAGGADWIAKALNNPALKTALRVFSVFCFFALPTLVLDSTFVCNRKPWVSAGFNVIMKGGIFAISVLRFHRGDSLEQVCIWLAGLSAAQFVLAVILLGVNVGWPWPRWDVETVKQQLAYALPLGALALLGVLQIQLGKLVIANAYSPERYAVYQNGAIELPLHVIFTASAAAVMTPEFVRFFHGGMASEIPSLWGAATRRLSLIHFPVFVWLMVFAPEVVAFVFSPRYLESAHVFRIYLLLVPLRIANYGTILMATGRQKALLAVYSVSLVACFALNIGLLRLVGWLGPACATVLLNYLLGLTIMVIISRTLGASLRGIFPWKPLAKNMGLALLCGLVLLPWKLAGLPPLLGLLLAAAAYFPVFYLTAVRSGELRLSEYGFLFRRENKTKLEDATTSPQGSTRNSREMAGRGL